MLELSPTLKEIVVALVRLPKQLAMTDYVVSTAHAHAHAHVRTHTHRAVFIALWAPGQGSTN